MCLVQRHCCGSVLVMLLVAMTKHLTKNNVGRKGLFWFMVLGHSLPWWGRQGHESGSWLCQQGHKAHI